MDEDVESLLIAVRADTGGFDRDVAAMRASLTGGLGEGAAKAGRSIGTALARAAGDGKLSFDTLKAGALKALDEVAAAALKAGVGGLFGGGGGGLTGLATGLLGALFGLPGRATGGPVSPATPYLVGERGPELFVPTSAGRIMPAAGGGGGGGGREVRVAIQVAAPAGEAPRALARSSRQVARAVARALAEG